MSTINGECPKCGLEHDQVDVLRWLWLFRDTKPKPTGKGGLVLVMLAARMDAKTGCGWTTDPDLAELAGVADVGTVRAATRWGRDRLLLHRVSKGYRITDERTEKSHWLLTDPHRPTGNRLPHGKASQPGTGSPVAAASQPGTGSPVAAEPTGDLSGANRGSEPDPTGSPSPSIANPEKLIQEAHPSSSRRTPGTGGRGEPAATDDDDDSETRPERPGPGYGWCPECGGWFAVRAAGGCLAAHRDPRDWARWCDGSKQPPAEPVPCAGCGRTGLALTAFEGLCLACRRDRRDHAEAADEDQADDDEFVPPF